MKYLREIFDDWLMRAAGIIFVLTVALVIFNIYSDLPEQYPLFLGFDALHQHAEIERAAERHDGLNNDGAVCGAAVAWLYNFFSTMGKK